MLNGEVRGSGNTLYEAVYKTGAGMAQQGRMMASYTKVFAPVLAFTNDGYVMPRLREIENMDQVGASMVKLANLWNVDDIHNKQAWYRIQQNRMQYHNYVMTCDAPAELRQRANNWYLESQERRGKAVSILHGDCTVENSMLLNDSTVVWIDPCVRTGKPLEMELDCGKLLQSVYGYDIIPPGSADVILSFIKFVEADLALTNYYLASHLVRLWRHQPHRHEWAIDTMKGAL